MSERQGTEKDAPIVVRDQEGMNALWFHLTEDHGLGLSSLHGDPFLMHGAATMHGLCSRTYMDGRDTPPASTVASDD